MVIPSLDGRGQMALWRVRERKVGKPVGSLTRVSPPQVSAIITTGPGQYVRATRVPARLACLPTFSEQLRLRYRQQPTPGGHDVSR